MEKFQHFLLTRFNVKVSYDSSRTGINTEWLLHRLDLFEQFCYPSVCAQTSLNFQWLIYFDDETPEVFKEKIYKLKTWKNFLPIYICGEFSDQINREIISEFILKDTKYLITTRIDNDDAVSSDFIQLIQENFSEQEFEFLSFVNGYVLCSGKLYSLKYINNPFTSLIEKIKPGLDSNFKTIWCGKHSELSLLGKINRVNIDSTWLQVIHEKNISNRIRGVRQPIQKLLNSRFVIDFNNLPSYDNVWFFWPDKILSILRQPLELVGRRFPSSLKVKIKKILA